MCCAGVLHPHGALHPDEVEPMRALGLRVRVEAERAVFEQPCPRLSGTLCEVYESRPVTCAQYSCLLLKRFRAGEVSLDDASAAVARFRRALQTVAERLGSFPDAAGLSELKRREAEAPDPVAFRRANGPLLLALGRTLAASQCFLGKRPGP